MSYPHYSDDCVKYHDVVADFDCSGPEETCRPSIVVLCGSTRFYDAFQQANYDLTMRGKIVLSVGFYPHFKAEAGGHGEGVGHDSAEKVALDELHKRKIDLADEVYVLNVDDYIGDSTRNEIAYARAHHKPVTFLVPASGYMAPSCSVCSRERTVGTGEHQMDSYDYSPLQFLTGKSVGWYSGDDGEVCPECMTKMLANQ